MLHLNKKTKMMSIFVLLVVLDTQSNAAVLEQSFDGTSFINKATQLQGPNTLDERTDQWYIAHIQTVFAVGKACNTLTIYREPSCRSNWNSNICLASRNAIRALYPDCNKLMRTKEEAEALVKTTPEYINAHPANTNTVVLGQQILPTFSTTKPKAITPAQREVAQLRAQMVASGLLPASPQQMNPMNTKQTTLSTAPTTTQDSHTQHQDQTAQ